MEAKSHKAMEEVIVADGRYPIEAFSLLHEGLNRAVQDKHGEKAGTTGAHVSGADICHAIRALANERWGMMTKTVLKKWNIHETMDFGNMVYLMIEHDFLRRTDEDSLEDFRDVYDFDTAFAPSEKFDLKD